jgi:5'-3' exonuclease
VSAAPTIHLVDASLYVFRAYFASPAEFTDVEGAPVHAVHGFLGFLLGLLEQARPSHVLVAFDESLTTSFRNRLYPAYKANREPPPPDLERQFAYCREAVAALGLAGLADAEYEADDLIGSALHHARAAGARGVIVSGDKDLAQLVGDGDEIHDAARRERYGRDGVVARLGVEPEQVPDLLGLTGDAVDNIPGVPGIGPKTAIALLQHFETLDAVLARVEEIPWLRLRGAASVAAKLRAHRESALLSRELARIAIDAPVPTALDAYAVRPPDLAASEALLDRLRFGPMLRRRIRERAG